MFEESTLLPVRNTLRKASIEMGIGLPPMASQMIDRSRLQQVSNSASVDVHFRVYGMRHRNAASARHFPITLMVSN